jgi:hypothetical protein
VAAENQIRLGQPGDSTHGVQVLMGLTDASLGQFLQDPIAAIKKEFAQHGSADDKENLRCALDGIKRLGWTSGVSLQSLMAHEHAILAKVRKRLFFSHFYIKMIILPRQARDKHGENSKQTTVFLAQLKEHHILALRIYTTSSYAKINDPLRSVPPQRPHPFAATTFFIDQGIKVLLLATCLPACLSVLPVFLSCPILPLHCTALHCSLTLLRTVLT